jgi:tetratricopeptide (TPR) repeat protein
MLWLVLVAALGDSYLAAVQLGDSLYDIGRYDRALESYETAHRLMPTEPGAQTGMGWSLLRMGRYDAAEAELRGVLARNPGWPTAAAGLEALPPDYRLKLTLTGAAGPARANAGGFLQYNHRYRTTITAGLQWTRGDSAWQGWNSALVLYRRLAWPWAIRLDLFTLAAFNDPRYWRMVFAPGVTREVGEWQAGITVVAWDRLSTLAIQPRLTTPTRWRGRLGLAPVVNRGPAGFGWFLPLEVEWQALDPLKVRGGVGAGQIADHVDLDTPVLYNSTGALSVALRAGAELDFGRVRVGLFAAAERHEGGRLQPFISAAVTGLH